MLGLAGICMRTVLLVDDSPVVRHVLAPRLASEGFLVREAAAAADVHDSDASLLACAIIDLELDDRDGTDVAAALLARRRSLPVAFFTASGDSLLRERAQAHGPVFDKPNVEAIVAWAKQAAQPPPTK
jgi:CheY-like chemotaxis protein